MMSLLAVPLVGLQPFDPAGLALTALLNPVVIGVAVWMGLNANQWQKLPVAGFAAAFAGALAVWFATFFQVLPARGYGGEAGLFVMSFFYGTVLATVAYLFFRRRRTTTPD